MPSFVHANSSRNEMPRETSSYVSLLLFCATIIHNAGCTSGISDRCLELIRFDVDDIESHLSKLNLTDVPTVKMMNAGFKCPISALPFGTLKSDWARLLLLQEAQPDSSIIKLKLVRLMRLLIIAYYQMEERIDVTIPENAKKSLAGETTTTQPYCPNRGNSSGASSNNANRHCSYTDSFSNNVTRLVTKSDCPKTRSNATVIEIVTMKSLPSPSGTTTVIPSDTARQDNVTSLIHLGATTTQHYPDDVKKAALKTLGNCLKHSFKDVAQRRRSGSKVFEILKNKKYIESEKLNEIDDRGNRTVIRITPPKNEFWRYVTFPTRAPLTAASMVPAYRMRELSDLKTGPRKSWKRMKLNNDIYKSFRRFYGIGKNEKDTK